MARVAARYSQSIGEGTGEFCILHGQELPDLCSKSVQ